MKKALQFFALTLVFLLVAFATFWGTLALWFKVPGADLLRMSSAAGFALLGFGTLVSIARPQRWPWLSVFVLALLAVLAWWNTLVPPMQGNWAPELARQVTGTVKGDVLTLENVRDFEWRTEEDFTANWETRNYDLSQIDSVDLFMSYWGGPLMGHYMLSFGFSDGRYLAWSIEVRRQGDDAFSPVADFFKAHPIAVVASEERDVVGLRSNIQRASVRMFRIRTTPESARALIEAYVSGANEIVTKPHWFNSVFTNCSRTSILLARHAGVDLPIDWRVIVNGYFPNYLYDLDALDSDTSIEDLYRRGDISERARAEGLTKVYSSLIREGVPDPNGR